MDPVHPRDPGSIDLSNGPAETPGSGFPQVLHEESVGIIGRSPFLFVDPDQEMPGREDSGIRPGHGSLSNGGQTSRATNRLIIQPYQEIMVTYRTGDDLGLKVTLDIGRGVELDSLVAVRATKRRINSRIGMIGPSHILGFFVGGQSTFGNPRHHLFPLNIRRFKPLRKQLP